MTNIHFIINPIAGSAKSILNEGLLLKYFDKESYHIVVKYSDFKKHAIQLTLESIENQAHIIVACGGDGTINEVASCLIHTPIILGVIPTGSGNGLAATLNIPKNIINAIAIIKQQKTKLIDAGKLNDKMFFSNSGIGFDAQVVKHYESSGQRKLPSYIKACLRALKSFKGKGNIRAHINGEELHLDPFLIFASNSNEMGYNVSLTPRASIQDGVLDVLMVPKMNMIKTLCFGFLILFKKHHLFPGVKAYTTTKMTLSLSSQNVFETQIDGEFFETHTNIINISILENALHVIAS
ncbi:diacylglycerol/lipid kinase family protein [Mariniflexile ostreae]|uniref:Diacylglycerol/lipid kinase family protein n=1 Tax=Mariniflexile ostreae TaxID=1520892 RepID=A0ABV5FCF3_9FLAO